ncbi:MAG: ribulose-phosphate 3-epimerase [Bacteriovorax sp.]|nr:ribulose-phosphate 3-epimerase [Bacteriovorax sp.]
MTIISPSLLACDFLNIQSELNAFDNIDNIWFHLDIMDGHFVPNLTFGPPIIELIIKYSKHKCDAHFMVTNPEFYSDLLKGKGLYNFTFHFEAIASPIKYIQTLKNNFPSIGISIKPNTIVSELSDELLKLIDVVLVMSVEPGFGGQAFIENTFTKIIELKLRREKLKSNFQIQIDGGVNDKNAHDLIKIGADNLVAGSYIFKNNPVDYAKAISSIR